MIHQFQNWAYDTPRNISDGDTILRCNISQFAIKNVLKGVKNLNIVDSNLVNCRVNPSWSLSRCNTSVNKYSSQPGDKYDMIDYEKNLDKQVAKLYRKSQRAELFKKLYKNKQLNKVIEQMYAHEINEAIGEMVATSDSKNRPRGVAYGWKKVSSDYKILIDTVTNRLEREIKLLGYE